MADPHIELSKFLSYVLRHQPQAIGLTLDQEGWASLASLIDGARQTGRSLDEALIRAVVASSQKQRFAISEDGLRIRAVQGHSTKAVMLSYPEKVPPEFLYHGTATRFLDAILKEGLKPGHRHHVHLSTDRDTAISVGKRYGTPVVLTVHATRMHQQGSKFYQAENGVWLVEHVPAEFLKI